jgi:hypothetical protein
MAEVNTKSTTLAMAILWFTTVEFLDSTNQPLEIKA